MGMVVRTNVMSNNAFRQLGMNNNAVSKSLEKLASGFRINRAGDDAAGLAISERMKAQIKGLDAAANNSQDGISLVQTAEGALNEVHDMLNRMVELATKAANGTYTDAQRGNYQDEMTQLQNEIDRIADSTNFNSQKLLDGSMDGINRANAAVTGKTNKGVNDFSFSVDSGSKSGIIVKFAAANKTGSATATAAWGSGDNTLTITIQGQVGEEITQKQIDDAIAAATENRPADLEDFSVKLSGNIEISTNTSQGDLGAAAATAASGEALELQVGDTYENFNMLKVNVGDMHTKALGVDKDSINVRDQKAAGAAINAINNAIDNVSKTRSGLGAIQNRLEHTINNLETTSENLTAAHSRIRDTDMAKEMMNYTKMNVLTQSAQAMLAQANQQPQAILQLLQ